VRVIATSNRDMPEEVAARRFREDLYYRLNVFPLTTRALAERPDDIPVLAAALVRRHAPEGQPLPMLTPEAISTLMAHDWPGNVRELENVIQRALVMSEGGVIAPEDIMLNAGAEMAAQVLARAV
ncbi:MAG: sigma-54-dependent Fis family transcriptional regulator, partial [Rhodobacteraceae bacterium]|nr:sigma-54-dependent Fis family transcriptional regulator [Paracoccaceae bacterium]